MSNKRVKRSSPSETKMIPYDLFEDILVRLSENSLTRFKSVSKSFRSLIENPTFASKQLLRGPKPVVILLPSGNANVFILENPDHDRAPRNWNTPTMEGTVMWVLGHCNGLICFATYERRTPMPYGDMYLNLWNPALKQQKKLEFSTLLPEPNRCISSIDDYLGFGQDRKTGDYKIARFAFYHRIFGDERTRYALGEVYSLREDSWRRVAHSPSLPPNTMWGGYWRLEGVYSGGFCYWVGLGSDHRNAVVSLLSFDLADEVLRLVNLPDPVHLLLAEMAPPIRPIRDHFVAKPMVRNGSLCAVAFTRDAVGPKWVGVWELGDVNDDAVSIKKFSAIELDGSFDDRHWSPALFWGDEMILTSRPGVRCVNMTTRRVENIEFDESCRNLNFRISDYIKSIVSPM